MRHVPLAALAWSLVVFALASPATADPLTSGDVENLFQRQQDQLGKPRSLELDGEPAEKVRGLVLYVGGAQPEEIEFDAVARDSQVNVPVIFDLNSAALRDDQKPALQPVCSAMRNMADTRFRVIGHTDASGAETYNLSLSLDRAISVSAYLQSNCGIEAERLQTVGVGERYLADPERPGSSANRRVEFQVAGGGQG